MPIRYSPRPVRAMARRAGRIALAVLYRLLVAVAVAGTIVHAALFWPQSVMLAFAVVGVMYLAVVTAGRPVTR